VRVEPKTIGHTTNRYTTSRKAFSWQSDLILGIASCQETESSTGGTIAPADLLLADQISLVK